MIVSIFSPSAGAVKPRRHSRILRADITAPEIDPALRAFGRHIARSHRKGTWCPHPRDEKYRPRAGTPHAGTETRI